MERLAHSDISEYKTVSTRKFGDSPSLTKTEGLRKTGYTDKEFEMFGSGEKKKNGKSF